MSVTRRITVSAPVILAFSVTAPFGAALSEGVSPLAAAPPLVVSVIVEVITARPTPPSAAQYSLIL